MPKKRKQQKPQGAVKNQNRKVSEHSLYGPATQAFMKKKASGFICQLSRKEIEEDFASIFAQVPRQKRVVNSKYLSPASPPPHQRLRMGGRGPAKRGVNQIPEQKSPRNTSSEEGHEEQQHVQQQHQHQQQQQQQYQPQQQPPQQLQHQQQQIVQHQMQQIVTGLDM